jgi:hypothetical protein
MAIVVSIFYFDSSAANVKRFFPGIMPDHLYPVFQDNEMHLASSRFIKRIAYYTDDILKRTGLKNLIKKKRDYDVYNYSM